MQYSNEKGNFERKTMTLGRFTGLKNAAKIDFLPTVCICQRRTSVSSLKPCALNFGDLADIFLLDTLGVAMDEKYECFLTGRSQKGVNMVMIKSSAFSQKT